MAGGRAAPNVMKSDGDSTISLQLPAEPRSVPTARHALQRFAARAGADVDAVALAVSEAVTNAIQHGYPNARGEISVRAIANDELRVIVSDRGAGCAPTVDEGRPHLGLPLIGHLADGVDMTTGRDGVEIEMRFARAG